MFKLHRAFDNPTGTGELSVMEHIALNQAWSAYRMGEITFDDFFTFALALA